MLLVAGPNTYSQFKKKRFLEFERKKFKILVSRVLLRKDTETLFSCIL